MNDNDKIRDLIPGYLTGSISEDDRKALEERLHNDPDLMQEYREIGELYIGTKILDQLNEDHVDSAMLADYADNPNSLDVNSKEEIEQHLKSCDTCSEELRLCHEAIVRSSVVKVSSSESLFKKILDTLFPTSFSIQPAVAYFAVILIAIGAYYTLNQTGSMETAKYELFGMQQRGSTDLPVIKIEPGTKVVELTFKLPTRESVLYTLTLHGPAGKPIQSYHNISHDLSNLQIAIEIPTSYLSNGRHLLRAIEERDTEITDEKLQNMIETEFIVKFVN